MGRLDREKNITEFERIMENQSKFTNAQFEIRFGGVCPVCEIGILDYDGMLNLICPNCGYSAGGCFT